MQHCHFQSEAEVEYVAEEDFEESDLSDMEVGKLIPLLITL